MTLKADEGVDCVFNDMFLVSTRLPVTQAVKCSPLSTTAQLAVATVVITTEVATGFAAMRAQLVLLFSHVVASSSTTERVHRPLHIIPTLY